MKWKRRIPSGVNRNEVWQDHSIQNDELLAYLALDQVELATLAALIFFFTK